MKYVITNKAIRLRFPSRLTNKKWQIEDFDSRKVFSIQNQIAIVLAFCFMPKKIDELLFELMELFNLTGAQSDQFVKTLLDKEFLLESEKESISNSKSNTELFQSVFEKWRMNHWDSAAEYHFFTYDYKFLNYSKQAGGRKIALERMAEYSKEKIDDDRVKQYSQNHDNTPLPNINEFQEKSCDLSKLPSDYDKALWTLSFAFQKTIEGSIQWEGAPLIRRTSPSGGSRHPIEGYFLSFGKSFKKGVYHIQSSPGELVNIHSDTSEQLNEATFFSDKNPIKYDENNLIGVILLTCIFERNMFRYRDPRTFRSVHMDCGHIVGTIELIARVTNLKTNVYYDLPDFEYIEKILELNPLEESLMTAVALHSPN